MTSGPPQDTKPHQQSCLPNLSLIHPSPVKGLQAIIQPQTEHTGKHMPQDIHPCWSIQLMTGAWRAHLCLQLSDTSIGFLTLLLHLLQLLTKLLSMLHGCLPCLALSLMLLLKCCQCICIHNKTTYHTHQRKQK